MVNGWWMRRLVAAAAVVIVHAVASLHARAAHRIDLIAGGATHRVALAPDEEQEDRQDSSCASTIWSCAVRWVRTWRDLPAARGQAGHHTPVLHEIRREVVKPGNSDPATRAFVPADAVAARRSDSRLVRHCSRHNPARLRLGLRSSRSRASIASALQRSLFRDASGPRLARIWACSARIASQDPAEFSRPASTTPLERQGLSER